MTTPQQPSADLQNETELAEDLPLPADTQEQITGGEFTIKKTTD